ncbi:RNA binding protein protein [Babesia ovis]|uniref:RNA binding protein protein n=1 Tax=Babesia ovis TaxID=5869 RepID=A0A9W5T9Y7_BABOV|nr:RNA binding protein protein [Babesia ovis]
MWDSNWASQGRRIPPASTASVNPPASSGKQRRGHVTYNPDDVYDPLYPNVYERLSRELLQRSRPPPSKVELKITPVEAPKLSAEEAYERRMKLLDEAERQQSQSGPPPSSAPPDEGPKDVGMRIMQKLGWTHGKGLGANEQGIVAPLVAKNTGKHVGVIVQDTAPLAKRGNTKAGAKKSAAMDGTSQSSSTDASATRILRLSLQGCQTPSEELQEQIEESMCQFGSLLNVSVLGTDDVTVYCEFEDSSQAVKASNNLDRVLPGYNKTSFFASEEEYGNL